MCTGDFRFRFLTRSVMDAVHGGNTNVRGILCRSNGMSRELGWPACDRSSLIPGRSAR